MLTMKLSWLMCCSFAILRVPKKYGDHKMTQLFCPQYKSEEFNYYSLLVDVLIQRSTVTTYTKQVREN